MKLRGKDVKAIAELVASQLLNSLATSPDTADAFRTLVDNAIEKKLNNGELVLASGHEFLVETHLESTYPELIKLLSEIDPYNTPEKKPVAAIQFSGDALDDPTKPLTFTLEGEEAPRSATQTVVIHNSGDNPTFNVFSQSRKRDKMSMIEDNLQRLAAEGIPFTRMTTYQVQVDHLHETWNFYLTSEKFHRTGLPAEGKGIDNFIALMKHNHGKRA